MVLSRERRSLLHCCRLREPWKLEFVLDCCLLASESIFRGFGLSGESPALFSFLKKVVSFFFYLNTYECASHHAFRRSSFNIPTRPSFFSQMSHLGIVCDSTCNRMRLKRCYMYGAKRLGDIASLILWVRGCVGPKTVPQYAVVL